MLKLLLFLALMAPGAWARSSNLTWLEEAFIVTQTIFKQFPSYDYEYLTIGSSPTPIDILMGLSSEATYAHHLPFSIPKFRTQWSNLFFLEKGQEINLLDYPPLRAHFQKFLPAPGELKGKKLVLIDYISRGQTLHYLLPLLEQYYGGQVTFSVFGMKYIDDASDFTRIRNQHLTPIKLRYEVKLWEFDGNSFYGQAMMDGDFDHLSPWITSYPEQRAPVSVKNPHYESLKKSMSDAIIRPPMPLPRPTPSKCFASATGL